MVQLVTDALVMAAKGAVAGIVVTSGSFTPDVVEFTPGRNIRLIEGPELWQFGETLAIPSVVLGPADRSHGEPSCSACCGLMESLIRGSYRLHSARHGESRMTDGPTDGGKELFLSDCAAARWCSGVSRTSRALGASCRAWSTPVTCSTGRASSSEPQQSLCWSACRWP
jgi:hypothetical protein